MSQKGDNAPNALYNQLIDCRIVYGESLYILAVLQILHENTIYGALNLRKSWKTFQGAFTESEKAKKNGNPIDEEVLECLRFDIGLFLYAMSVLPSALLTIVKIFGFEGTFIFGKCIGLSLITKNITSHWKQLIEKLGSNS